MSLLCLKPNDRKRQICISKYEMHLFGVSFGTKGRKILDLDTQEIYISRDVVFYENQFPFALPTTKASSMERVYNDKDNACWLDEIEATGYRRNNGPPSCDGPKTSTSAHYRMDWQSPSLRRPAEGVWGA